MFYALYMTAYLFAGQGSQYIGMGKDLYDAFPESRAIFDKADRALGLSISGLCFEGPQEELTQTQNCQPAILTVTIAAFEAFNSAARSGAFNSSVSYAAGLSLGEYSALVAAGALGFEDAVRLVRRRGEFMEEAARTSPGKMASILGLELTVIKDICKEAGVEVANINCPGQIVISGAALKIEEALKLAQDKGAKRAMLLDVSGAFHSSLMQEASLKLAKELDKVNINEPIIPVVSNVDAGVAVSAAQIKENLIKQVYSSVLWEDSMRFILSAGTMNFVEFGPGKVLRGLMRRIGENAQVINIEKKSDIIALESEGFFKGTKE